MAPKDSLDLVLCLHPRGFLSSSFGLAVGARDFGQPNRYLVAKLRSFQNSVPKASLAGLQILVDPGPLKRAKCLCRSKVSLNVLMLPGSSCEKKNSSSLYLSPQFSLSDPHSVTSALLIPLQ